MAGKNWIVGDRSAVAAELIYDAAAELIASDGLSAFDIDKLAARVHCSRATIYRYAGAKPRSAMLSSRGPRRASSNPFAHRPKASLALSEWSPRSSLRLPASVPTHWAGILSDRSQRAQTGPSGSWVPSWYPTSRPISPESPAVTTRPGGGWFEWCCR
ncbi:bacterial regulatory s, tetR family protein [Mycobacterium ulcerans str. Harvey]|uniref:Bacterial regulatory s, tetR family protein n=1 Tax=Mycobacterium ulcerans str. Harvey TaxID=1299332 RepID=A0ABP3AFZ7_MYCUL|nr:bacterial regulatory s, tetR family protein [Mycobacterium ulcerans str. Harvey]